jgi:hypothetical protein
MLFQQRDVQKQVFYATAFVAGLIAYAFWENPVLVEFRYGVIITALLMLLIGSPLHSLVSSVLGQWRTTMAVATTTVAAGWMRPILYGRCTHDAHAVSAASQPQWPLFCHTT